MRVCLIGSPTVTEFEETAEAESEQVKESSTELQLGVLSLAAVLESISCDVQVVDLNNLYYKYLAVRDKGQDFCGFASRAIISHDADVYGFSSICSSYPLSIRIASEVEAARPDATVVFGGPQASVVDTETLTTFPFIDFVLRGESEQTFPKLLDEISGARRFASVPGLTYRNGSRIMRNPNAPVIEDLDQLPIPAYHLAANLSDVSLASLELGRGCPFACKFCSTNDFFRRRFRVKTPGRMLDEMRHIARHYGFRKFDLVHDMFTVDRKRVVAFCDEMLASGEGFRWACSARTDCVDDELLELMSRAGCMSVFFGVESGSPRMQRIIDKHLDVTKAKAMIDSAEKHGIEATVSLITGFPEEENADLRGTIDVYMHAVRTPHATPQLNVLAPLAATPIYINHRDELVLDDLCSDISHQGRHQNVVDRLLIESHRDIFPNFYLLPTPHLDRAYVLELREFLLMATARVRWLLAALDLSSSGILDVFSEWRAYRSQHRPALKGGDLRHYYRLRVFRWDFVDFLRARLPQWDSLSVRALLDYEEVLARSIAEDEVLGPLREIAPAALPLEWHDRPRRKNQVYVFELDWDIEAVLSCARKREQPGDEAVRRQAFYASRPRSKESARLVEIRPEGAFILKLCSGKSSVAEIVERFSARYEAEHGPAAEMLCVSILEALVQRGFLAIQRESEITALSSAFTPRAFQFRNPALESADCAQ